MSNLESILTRLDAHERLIRSLWQILADREPSIDLDPKQAARDLSSLEIPDTSGRMLKEELSLLTERLIHIEATIDRFEPKSLNRREHFHIWNSILDLLAVAESVNIGEAPIHHAIPIRIFLRLRK